MDERAVLPVPHRRHPGELKPGEELEAAADLGDGSHRQRRRPPFAFAVRRLRRGEPMRAQGHEAAIPGEYAAVSRRAFARDDPDEPAADRPVQRGDDQAARHGLLQPGRRDRRHRASAQHPVVEHARREALGAVGRDTRRRVPGFREPCACRVHQFRVDVHCVHEPRAEPVAQQGGVVTGARADLQYPVPVGDPEFFEHDRHDRRLARRTRRRSRLGAQTTRPLPEPGVVVELHDQDVRGVDAPQPVVVAGLHRRPAVRRRDEETRQEDVPGHGAERGRPARVVQYAFGEQMLDEAPP